MLLCICLSLRFTYLTLILNNDLYLDKQFILIISSVTVLGSLSNCVWEFFQVLTAGNVLLCYFPALKGTNNHSNSINKITHTHYSQIKPSWHMNLLS